MRTTNSNIRLLLLLVSFLLAANTTLAQSPGQEQVNTDDYFHQSHGVSIHPSMYQSERD